MEAKKKSPVAKARPTAKASIVVAGARKPAARVARAPHAANDEVTMVVMPAAMKPRHFTAAAIRKAVKVATCK